MVDGITSNDLNIELDGLSTIKPVKSSYSPKTSPATLIASMMTGANPRNHGIVSNFWDYMGKKEYAYIHVFPDIAQITDVLAQYSHGTSHIISGSANPMYARAFGVRPQLNAYSTHSSSIIFNHHTKIIESTLGKGPITPLTEDDILHYISTHFKNEMFYKSPEHLALYSEICMMIKSISEIESHLKSVEFPDMYSFAISALNPIKAIHGQFSDEYLSSLLLVHKAVSRAIEKFQHAYNDKAIYEILCVNYISAASHLETQTISNLIKSNDISLEFFPHIYNQDPHYCTVIQKSGILAFCPHSPQIRLSEQSSWIASRVMIKSSNQTTNQTESETNNFETIANWHMFIWTSLILLLITYFIWYAMFTMDIGTNSLLYRLTDIPDSEKVVIKQ